MSRPTVSAVFAAYNATWCIARAIDSLLAGTVVPEEIIVCDDGSTDGMPEYIEGKYGDRVQVLRLPHRNAAAARRDGLAIAKGDWLAFIDADDWWTPEKLGRQLAFLEKHPQVRWLSTDGDYVAEEGVVKESWLGDYFQPVRERTGDLFEPLVHRCFPLLSSMLVEREAYHAVGGIDPTIVYSHDYDLWLRLAARHPGGLMTDKLVHYWFHAAALSRNFDARHRDNLVIMERVAAGAYRAEPELRALGAVRAAGLAYDVGIAAIRAGKYGEGRAFLARARDAGPARRRAIATFGSLMPAPLMKPLMQMSWLKQLVLRERPTAPVLKGGGGA